MEFIETPIFTSQVERLLSHEEYRGLQLALVLRPGQGAVIRGGGGIRKVRWRQPGTGKRGGVRVIYYWATAEATIYMLFIYPKTQQSDLTKEQLKVLRRLVEEEFK
jgi:hypothetical protein